MESSEETKFWTERNESQIDGKSGDNTVQIYEKRETPEFVQPNKLLTAHQCNITIVDGIENHGQTGTFGRLHSFSLLISSILQKNPISRRHWSTLALAYQTLGVVFGGFATCPLYTYSTINIPNASEEDYLGVLSIIFWTLTLIGGIKHAFILLEADDDGEGAHDDGEGGTFALYSLLCQHSNIGGQNNERKQSSKNWNKGDQSNTSKQNCSSSHLKVVGLLEGNKTVQKILFAVTMLGSCMLIGDGIFTPIISVLAAVGGLNNAIPSISEDVIVAISAMLLVILFLLQRFGTDHMSFFFSPVIAIWMVTTSLIGAYNIIVHYPTVIKAVSPHYIAIFFSRNGKIAWLALTGCLICVAGAETMHADLGHYNKRSIQLAFVIALYPSNLITYAGQTAYLIKHPSDHSLGFFDFIPTSFFWPMFFVSTLAAIVASQGLISACFSLIKQSIEMDHFPRVKMVHTSKNREGQVYSPQVNYLLMAFCVIIILGFHNATALGNAYGVTVILVIFITTLLFSLVMLVVWDTPLPLVVAFIGVFILVEGAYFGTVLTQVPQGGWLAIVVAIFIAGIMYIWIYGRQKEHEYDMENRITVDSLDTFLATTNIRRVPGVCIFYSDLADDVPPVICHYLKNVRSLHEIIAITNVNKARVPIITKADRFRFWQAGHEGVYRCIVQIGYAETKVEMGEWENFSQKLLEDFQAYMRGRTTNQTVLSLTQAKQAVVDVATGKSPVFVVGRTQLVVKGGRSSLKGWVIDKMYGFLHTNWGYGVSLLSVPPPGLVEIGMLYEV